jgi:hypothetical protein
MSDHRQSLRGGDAQRFEWLGRLGNSSSSMVQSTGCDRRFDASGRSIVRTSRPLAYAARFCW